MTHLYVVARGQINRLKQWEDELSSKYFPYLISPGRRNNTNTGWLTPPKYGMLQLAVRPIQLYEIVFPKECLNDVLQMIQPYGGYGISPKVISIVRKGLSLSGTKLLPIPKVEPEQLYFDENGKPIPQKNFLNRDYIDVMGIGIKEDKEVQMDSVEDL